MGITNYRLDVTTDASGAATVYSEGGVKGLVEQIRYTPDAGSPLATGSDIVLSEENTGLPIVTKANIGTSAFTLAPRQPTHLNSDGSAALYAAAGAAVLSRIALTGGRIKLVVAEGGNTLSGRFDVAVRDT